MSGFDGFSFDGQGGPPFGGPPFGQPMGMPMGQPMGMPMGQPMGMPMGPDMYNTPGLAGYAGGPMDGLHQMGDIDYSSPPDFSPQFRVGAGVSLLGLNFQQVEIDTCRNIYMEMMQNLGKPKFSVQFIQQVYGYDYNTATRLKYLYDIAQGKVQIDTDDQLCRHLKKMQQGYHKITVADLPESGIYEVPKLCIIGEVTDPLFHCYNSALYDIKERFYRVVQATPSKVVIRTKRKPEIKFRGMKESKDVAKIIAENADGSIDVQFEPKFVRLCNRYIILASTKHQEFHLGCYEDIMPDGNKMYTFARILPAKSDLKYKAATERVLDFGIFPEELKGRLQRAAAAVHVKLKCVKVTIHEPNTNFELLYNPAAEYDTDEDGSDTSIDEMLIDI